MTRRARLTMVTRPCLASMAIGFVLLFASSGGAQPSSAQTDPASKEETSCAPLTGAVTDGASGEGLGSVTVQFRPSAEDATVSTVETEADGGFSFADACAPEGTIEINHPGYRRVTRPLPREKRTLTLALEPERLVRLDDVIVLAPQAIQTSEGPHVVTLDEEALASLRGRHLAGTLAEVPGVTMLQAGPASAKPVVRGQFGRRLLTLFDGVRHESQDWGVDHAPEIDPFAAGSLSVVKGAAGVRYGPDAVGGVVRIEPRPLRLQSGVDGELHLIGVDNGLRGTVAGRVDAATDWLPGFSLRLEGNAAKGASVSTPDYVLGNTASESLNGAITGGYTGTLFGNVVEAKLSLRHHQARLGVCYCLAATTPEDLRELVRAERPLSADLWETSFEFERPFQTVIHDLLLARVSTELFGFGEISATYSFQLDVRDEFDTARRSIAGPQFHFELSTHTVDAVYAHPSLPFGRFRLDGTAGGQFLVQENVYSGLQLLPNYRRFMGGVFAIESLTIGNALGGTLVLEVGGRYDQVVQTAFLRRNAYNAQRRRGRLTEEACTVREDEIAECRVVLPAFSVSTSATWTTPLPRAIGKGSVLSLVGDLSSATRFPDADELYLGGRSPSFPVFGLGNGSLGPETTLQAALALSIQSPLFATEVSAYANQVQDYIAFGPEIGPDGEPRIDVLIQGAFPRFVYESTDALFYGLDVSGVIAPQGWVSVTGQLSMVRGLNATTGGYLPFVPPPQASVKVAANVPEVSIFGPSTVALGGRGVVPQTRFDRNSDFVRPPSGYLLFDAEARTRLTVFEQQAALSLEVKNLFNQATREYLSLLRYYVDQPGREIWLRLSVDFKTL